MTKNTSTSRKIKNRKRNKDTNRCSDNPKNTIPKHLIPYTALLLTSLTLRKSKTEKNKKIKYTLKKKQH